MTTLMVWRRLHIFMSFSLQGPHLDTFPKIHSIFLILLSLLPMTLNIHCALSSIQKWCLRLTENFLLQSQLPSSSKFSTDSLTDPALLTSRDTVSCWEGDSTLKSRSVFWWFTIIQVLPPIYSLCSRKLAGVNGAFPSLPLSFGTRRSCWSGGSLNSKSKEFCVLQQPWYSPFKETSLCPPLIWPHWRVLTDAWHIHSQGSRQPRLLAGCCLMMIQSRATAWVIVSGMVGKRPWQDQRGKMLRVGCLLSRVHRKG